MPYLAIKQQANNYSTRLSAGLRSVGIDTCAEILHLPVGYLPLVFALNYVLGYEEDHSIHRQHGQSGWELITLDEKTVMIVFSTQLDRGHCESCEILVEQ